MVLQVKINLKQILHSKILKALEKKQTFVTAIGLHTWLWAVKLEIKQDVSKISPQV